MQVTTSDDRRRELESLLTKLREHPERKWTEERERVAVLQRMLAAEEAAK